MRTRSAFRRQESNRSVALLCLRFRGGGLVMRKHRKATKPDVSEPCGGDGGSANSLLPKRVLRGWIACCGAAGLSACSVGPDFKFPDTGLPRSYIASPHGGAAATAEIVEHVDLTQWWHSFRDPQLVSLVGRAIAGNPDIGIALA